MGLELFALGLVASQLAVYGLVIGEFTQFKIPCVLLSLVTLVFFFLFFFGGGGS